MKKTTHFIMIGIMMVNMATQSMRHSHKISKLEEPPQKIEQFHEIATQYISDVSSLFNDLTPEERLFIYYMFRASLPGNRIATDQLHRHGVVVTELFENILNHADIIKKWVDKDAFDIDQFLKETETFLVYLWTNHGQYFLREDANSKRTPERLGFKSLTKDNVEKALEAITIEGLDAKLMTFNELIPTIFDTSLESTSCVEGNIEASGGNIYAPGFTQKDFEALPETDRTGVNSYFFIDTTDGKRVPCVQKYKIGGKYSEELAVASHWLQKAYNHSKKYPKQFDKHFVKSLELMIKFLKTGDEELFKQHSIEWLKSNSRLDYNFGFIEVYDDPMSRVGLFQAEVTIKCMDMKKVNVILPTLEKQLPFPAEFMRENIDDISAIPNASVNKIVFSSGHLGPLRCTAAYCLPNYPEIRSKYGSKQIMYQPDKSLTSLINPKLGRLLFNTKAQAAWLAKHDPDDQLSSLTWAVHCTLHETLGHGSSRLDKHTFKDGEKLSVGQATYKVGDTIPVTGENITEFLGGNFNALEELRAEIIALYTSIAMFDQLSEVGLYKDWPQKIGKNALIDQFIFDMAKTGLSRLLVQQKGTREISGAHARANTTIMNYLCDGGGLSLDQEEIEIDNVPHQVLGFSIKDREKVLSDIRNLMIRVQAIKSTGNGTDCENLINTYGRYVRDLKHIDIIQDNRAKIMGDLKVSTRIYPKLKPCYDKHHKKIVDVSASWPESFIEQQAEYRKQELSYF